MDSANILSTGSIEILTNNPQNASEELGSAPILQCLQIGPIPVDNTGNVPQYPRYCVVLGDGKHFIKALIARSLSHLIVLEELVKGCICRINQSYTAYVRGEHVLIIHHLSVLTYLGVHERIGGAVKVEAESWDAEYTSSLNFTPGYGLPYALPIDQFLPEIFTIIVSYLDQADKLRLALTSKRLHALVGTSLYRDIRIGGRESLAKFSTCASATPEVCDYVRTYSLEGDVCCAKHEEGMYFKISRFRRLRELCFRPAHQITDEHRLIVPLLTKIGTQMKLRSLRKVDIQLEYNPGHLGELGHVVLLMVWEAALSVFPFPQLEHISFVSRASQITKNDETAQYKVLRLDREDLGNARATTTLRTLKLQWNGLPLSAVSVLLQLPRSLESLTLIFSLRYRHSRVTSPIMLDVVLEPVSHSVQTLALLTVEDYQGTTPEDLGLQFTSTGLSQFTMLRDLTLPGTFLTSHHGFNGAGLWLPSSLETLCISNARFEDYPIPEPSALPEQQGFMRLDTRTEACLQVVADIIDRLPSLTMLKFPRESLASMENTYRFVSDPPILLVGSRFQPLLDRRVRVILELGFTAKVELGVQVFAGIEEI